MGACSQSADRERSIDPSTPSCHDRVTSWDPVLDALRC
jgi:hypothetical protein